MTKKARRARGRASRVDGHARGLVKNSSIVEMGRNAAELIRRLEAIGCAVVNKQVARQIRL